MFARLLRASLSAALLLLAVPAIASALTVSADGAEDHDHRRRLPTISPLVELDGAELKISDVFAATGRHRRAADAARAGLEPYEVHCPLRTAIIASLGGGAATCSTFASRA